MSLNITTEQMRSLKRILHAIRELRQHRHTATAELLVERVLRTFPDATLETNPLNGHVLLWGSGGPIADSESEL